MRCLPFDGIEGYFIQSRTILLRNSARNLIAGVRAFAWTEGNYFLVYFPFLDIHQFVPLPRKLAVYSLLLARETLLGGGAKSG